MPYYLKRQGREKGVFVRLGATNRQASQEMIHELERQRLHQSFDEQPAWDSTLEQLDLGPLQQAFRQVGKPLDRQKCMALS